MSPLVLFPVCLFKTHLFAPCSVPDTVLDSEVKEMMKMLFLRKELTVRQKGQMHRPILLHRSKCNNRGVREVLTELNCALITWKAQTLLTSRCLLSSAPPPIAIAFWSVYL